MNERKDVLDEFEKLAAYADDSADRSKIEEIASHLGISVVYREEKVEEDAPVLRIDRDGLSLVGGGMVMRGDLLRMLPRLRLSNLRSELLVRAASSKGARPGLSVIDATAGMGEDSFLLAAAGFSVTLYERDPIIAALLADSLRRASEERGASEIVSRMRLVKGDSISAMRALSAPPDVIYLDPMFPKRQKSGLTKKKFQLLHRLEAPCSDERELLAAAMSSQPSKIVVKRPMKAPPLAGVKPSYSIEGRGIRYDCLIPPYRPMPESER